MKVLVTANQKGGVGKTATAVHLAFDFAERGLKVVVIDLDGTQGNASYTLSAYGGEHGAIDIYDGGLVDLPPASEGSLLLLKADKRLVDVEQSVGLPEASPPLRAAMKALGAAGWDVCVIDTPPTLGVLLSSALLAADYVIAPIELEAYSIQGINTLAMVIANVKAGAPGVPANPKLHFLGMAPSKVDARNPRHVRHLQELEEAYPDLVIPASVGLRSSIADALATGVPVWKIQKTTARKAGAEVRALAAYVAERMEIA